jgi:hypothetical protein
MQHEHLGRKRRPVPQFVCDAMRPKALATVFDEAISMLMLVSAPKPAFVQIIDFDVLPEAICNRDRRSASHIQQYIDGAP